MADEKLRNWIARSAIGLDAANPRAAVDKLLAALPPEIELLGLGEPTHMMEIFLSFRNRVFKHLVENHGFTAVAIESSFPRSGVINRYIGAIPGFAGESYDEIAPLGFSHNLAPLEGSRHLIEWMRGYNSAHEKKLMFFGFDAPTEYMYSDSPRACLHFALDYLANVDPATAGDLRPQIDALLGTDADWENPAANMDYTKSIGRSPAARNLLPLAEKLLQVLRQLRGSHHLEALQHADLARQLLVYHAHVAANDPNRLANLLGLRDAMMAKNLIALLTRERLRTGGKIFVFAHNAHLQRGLARWQNMTWVPAGERVHAELATRYAAIGTALSSIPGGIGSPEPGTLENLLAASHSNVLIPTRPISRLAHDFEHLPTRKPPNPGYFPFTGESVRNFDALALL
jgi:erythromycin esterase-like protein